MKHLLAVLVLLVSSAQAEPPPNVAFILADDLGWNDVSLYGSKYYDDFATIAPRLQLSEFDVDAGDDQQLQADFYRDVMISSFSHPNFEAIIQWGFWENAHWKPDAALWRANWSLKPAGKVFVDLTTKQWWTDESGKTDSSGNCRVRGFLGEYEVSVTHNGETVTKKAALDRKGTRVVFSLGKP